MPFSSPTLRRKALLIGLLLLAGSWLTAFAFILWQLHGEALENGTDAAATYARNFSEHLTQTFQIISLTADNIDAATVRDDKREQLGRHLALALRPAPYLRSLSLLDANGTVTASSNRENIGKRIAVDDFYPSPLPGSRQIRVGRPWLGRDLARGRPGRDGEALPPDASYFIPILRRLDDRASGPWLLAALNPDYFVEHFGQLLPTAEGRVQMFRYDGLLLISSWPEDAPGTNEAAGPLLDRLRRSESGTLQQRLADGFSAITAYRASSRFPLLVAVHLDRQAIIEHWLDETRRLSLIVMPILLALSIAAFLIWRRERRIEMQRAELAKQRRLAASVFDASSDSVILTSPNGEILSTNPAFERISGYRNDEVIGRNPRLLASGLQDRQFYQELWRQLLATGCWQGEIVNRHKDGHLYSGLLTINAVTDDHGMLMHYVAVTVDITERKRHEQELLDAKERAETASRAKTTFLATMSHELRTPMNGVLGMTEVLLRSELNDKQRRQLGLIRDSAGNLLKILGEILEYSRIDARDICLEECAFSPAGLIDDLLAAHAGAASAKGLMLRCDTSRELPRTAIGAAETLRGILGRLLDNAIKFTSSGEVRVSAWSENAATADCRRLCIAVADTGIGMTPEQLEMIFTAFAQGDGSSSRAFGGSGLGLAICRRLATALGGRLEVDSQPATGSRFTLRVDVRLPPEVAASA